MFNSIKTIWKKYNLGFYVSITGSFIMGTIHLITVIINFSWLTFNYMLFCYLLMFTRVFIWFLRFKKSNYFYLSGAAWLTLVLIPLGVSLFKTTTDRELTIFIFDWIIYGYAFYAFLKPAISIVGLVKQKNSPNPEKNVLSWISLIGALFTMFMLEFTMLRTFSNEGIGSMWIIEITFQITIIALTLFVIGLFLYKTFRKTE